jgi:hypothetical protein
MSAGGRDLKWPGFHADGEPGRVEQERQREKQIKADNLSARIRAADPVQRDRIDPAIGRTFGDARDRDLYDDASRLRSFRGMNERNRDMRERFRWTQARLAGRAGRN